MTPPPLPPELLSPTRSILSPHPPTTNHSRLPSPLPLIRRGVPEPKPPTLAGSASRKDAQKLRRACEKAHAWPIAASLGWAGTKSCLRIANLRSAVQQARSASQSRSKPRKPSPLRCPLKIQPCKQVLAVHLRIDRDSQTRKTRSSKICSSSLPPSFKIGTSATGSSDRLRMQLPSIFFCFRS